MNWKRFVIALCMFSLVWLPKADVQAAAYQRSEADPLPEHPTRALLHQAPKQGVHYDPASRSWVFYGVPIEQVRYQIPGAGIDLMQLLFMSREGVLYKVWAAVGLDWGSDYLALGPWQSAEQVQTIRLHENLLKVYISETLGTLHPQVNETGMQWTNCPPGSACEYGKLLDTMHHDLSNLFIEHEMSPGWYPWGFLFWNLEIINQKPPYPTNIFSWRVE